MDRNKLTTTAKRPDTATMMEETVRAHNGFYLGVQWARRRRAPLYLVKADNGTTLDLCVTRQEANKTQRTEKGSRIYEQNGHELRRVA